MMPKFVWRIWSEIGVFRRIALFTVMLKALLLPKLLISAQKEQICGGSKSAKRDVVFALTHQEPKNVEELAAVFILQIIRHGNPNGAGLSA